MIHRILIVSLLILFISPAQANAIDNFTTIDNGNQWIVTYPVTGGTVEYYINKIPVPSQANDGIFQQFVSMVKYNDIELTHVPFYGGVSGLCLLSKETGWVSEVELNCPLELVFKYTNQDYTVRLIFTSDRPLLRIITDFTATETLTERFNVNWIFWQCIGGVYNPQNRVVVPCGEDQYYVIDGQAEGIHYFPSNEYWSLRMGAEKTSYQNITIGFVYKDSSIVQKVTEFSPKPDTWGPWAMGQDLYLDTNNQFGSDFDEVPYGLNQITNNIYNIYQEDEAGLRYSWMDTSGVTANS